MVRASLRKKIVVLYLPSEADVKRWQALAKSKCSSLSSWAFAMVELALETRPPPIPPTKEFNRLRKQVSELKEENKRMLRLNAQLIETQRVNAATIPRIELLEKSLKALLQRGGTWSDKKLRKQMRIDPLHSFDSFLEDRVALGEERNLNRNLELPYKEDPEDLRTLNRALHSLIDQGLVEEVERGFRWKGKKGKT